jgi:hypothetical protein
MASIACQHHISWVIEVAPGMHQCILCTEVVNKKQITPKFDDLPAEFRRHWDEFEAGAGAAGAMKH